MNCIIRCRFHKGIVFFWTGKIVPLVQVFIVIQSTHSNTDAEAAAAFLQLQGKMLGRFKTYDGRRPGAGVLKTGKEAP